MAHPPTLAHTLARFSTLDEYFRADIGGLDDGWFSAADLLDPANPLLTDLLDKQARDNPDMGARTKASYFIGEYAWYVLAPALGAYLIDRRLPDLAAHNLALQLQPFTWREGDKSWDIERFAVRFFNPACYALPDDPIQSAADTRCIPDEATLREALRTTIEAHMAPLIARVAALTRLGAHAQWLITADTLAYLCLHIGRLLGDEADGTAHGLALVRAAGSPLFSLKTHYIQVEAHGHCDTFRARGGCCRYYTVSASGDDYCSTCVLRQPADREQRLMDYMTQKYAQEPVSA